jgi:hypothetical protein
LKKSGVKWKASLNSAGLMFLPHWGRKPMNDHITAENFAAYVDGMLSPEKKSECENHFSHCPDCLDELVQIAAIMGGRDEIPARFLKEALGEKNKLTKPVLHLRLVFEIAAAFMLVVFIGYLFLSNYRFWQTSDQQKPSVMMDKDVRLADTPASARNSGIAPLEAERRDRAEDKKVKSELAKSSADQRLGDSLVLKKKKITVVGKGLPAAAEKSMPVSEPGNKLEEILVEQPQPAVEKESKPKKELAKDATIHETAGGVQMEFAVKDQASAKAMKTKATGAEQNLERQKKAGAAQPAVAGNKLDTDLARKEIIDKKTQPPVRIEGDVVWADLRNPELLSAWSWLQKGLALELQIDGAGKVTAVAVLGKIDPLLARQAKNEARKLLFSVSEKKSRRARLVANELPPN